MTYIIVTKPNEMNFMNGQNGTTLIHTEEAFLVWLWVNPNQTDLQAANVICANIINLA